MFWALLRTHFSPLTLPAAPAKMTVSWPKTYLHPQTLTLSLYYISRSEVNHGYMRKETS